MSKKAYKSQASSARAASAAFGGAFGNDSHVFGGVAASALSYVYEPPDLSGLSDPNISVAFKNVQKKDSTTKTKALEDLQNHIKALEKDGVEEAVLEAWIKVYPRTSIDSSRRVRQLAHTLQGQIAVSCGKRMSKHMPFIVPSWLAGLYDSDTVVSRAALESFKYTFATEERSEIVWRAYRGAILEYTQDIILKETDSTLSDPRTTSSDDATSKYARTAGCALIILTRTLEKLPKSDLETFSADISSLLKEESLWKLANHSDAFIRRCVLRFLVICLDVQIQGLEPHTISAQLLTVGLHTDHRGSALDYVKAIVRLSEDLPTVWTVDYSGTGKKSASNRFRRFLQKGSQGGSTEFWTYITRLMNVMPREIVLSHPLDASPEQDSSRVESPSLPVLEALREGATNKEELRTSSVSAWNAYLSACEIVMSNGESLTGPHFVRSSLFPLVHEFVCPSSGLSQWRVAGTRRQDVCSRACNIAMRSSLEGFEEQLLSLSSKVVEDFQTSLPEQSKDYNKSQDSISAEVGRWYRLLADLASKPASTAIIPTIKRIVVLEIVAAISVLKARNGKPYSSAGLLQMAVESLPDIVLTEARVQEALITFCNQDIPRLIMSPSAQSLIRLLNLMESSVDLVPAYKSCMQTVEQSPEFPAKYVAFKALLSSPGGVKAGLLSTETNKSLSRVIDQAVTEDNDQSWALLIAAMGNASVPKSLTDNILTTLMNGLSMEDSGRASLHGLELIADQDKTSIKDFAVRPEGSHLMSKLLFMSDATDPDVSRQAKRLTSDIEGALSSTGDITQTTRSLVKVIQTEFDIAGPESLSIDSLVDQSSRLLAQTEQKDQQSTVTELLPNSTQWTSALAPFIARPLDPSLAVTNTLGAALVMVRPAFKASSAPASSVLRDREGRSVLLRIVQYVTKMVQTTDCLPEASEAVRLTLFQNLAVALQLAGDDLKLSNSVPLWTTSDPNIENEMVESIFDAQRLLADWSTMDVMSLVLPRTQKELLKSSEGLSRSSLYHARAYVSINDQVAEVTGHASISHDTDRIKAIRNSSDIFADMVILLTADCKDVVRACNELLSELTTYKFDEDPDRQMEGLRKLLLLNCLLYRPDDMVHDISQQRLIFFAQHIVSELDAASFAPAIEIARSLNVVLPAIRDIYGSFWGDVLDFEISMRQHPVDDEHLSGRHVFLRLLATLTKPEMLEANDDLLDAWTERKQPIMEDLVNLLEETSRLPDQSNQPRQMFNDLLSRLLAGSSNLLTDKEETLLPVLASESVSLQRTAFEILHEQIPLKQEKASLDKALTKGLEAKMPEELLSLILAPPSMTELAESSFERSVPPVLRGYLLSWMLIFDHWKNASNALQADYAKSLTTEGTYLNDLLDLTFNLLISAQSKPVDASKFDCETYTIDVETPERDTHWLLIHLYFLCLKYLPIPSKAWWRDNTSRQVNIAVEAWTQKYISRLIIASELDSIREWAPTQATGDQPLTIKVASSTREIAASIPVDEQTMVIVIRLPPAYPLARAEVEGAHRVGVPEKKWASWIRNAQGQLTIANSEGGGNALIDCLLAWRKNVSAAMKGQSECAICYSVVGADRTLPSKVCKTCKNKFHGSCLFRWFSSSNSSSCPLCRNTFTYS